MAEIYNIGGASENKIREYRSFEAQSIEVENEYSSYSEILKIFREAFCLVDITQIIRKL